MSEPIIYVDRSEIRDGRFEELEAAMDELVEFVESSEPQLIGYNVYFSRDRKQMTVIHVHPDAESLRFHMEIAGGMFPRFGEFIRLTGIDIYGDPGEDLVARLEDKAAMLGSGTVRVHEQHAGVARLPG